MRQVICFVIIFLSSFVRPSLFAQANSEKDYFYEEIKKQGELYNSQPNFVTAQYFFLKKQWDSTLIHTSKQLNNQNTSSQLKDLCHFFRGYAFYSKAMFEEAQKEFLDIPEAFPFKNQVTMYLGSIALEQSKFIEALEYLKQIENYSKQELLGVQKNNIEENIGLCYVHLERFKEATPYLDRAVTILKNNKDTIGLIGTYGNIATSYYDQYEDATAITYFKKAYDLALLYNDIESKWRATANMAVVEKDRNDFKKAFQYKTEQEKYTTQLNNQNKIYEVAQLEKRFAIEQKEKELDVLEAENKAKSAQRNGLLLSAAVLVLLLSTVFYFYREKVKSNKIITTQNNDLDALNATKDKLFSIVSHDLRSSVNALKNSNANLLDNVTAKEDKNLNSLLKSNSAIVNGAYTLLDNLLNWALLQTKQSHFNIEEQRLYFIVEQVAHNYAGLMAEKTITFVNTVSKKDKVLADQESLKLILRNLIDNAIKFSKEDDSIKIYTKHHSNKFCDLIVEDTGLGMTEETRLNLEKDTTFLAKKENEDIIGSGLGIQLCKSMITKNAGLFKIESTLGKGSKMIVSLSKPV